MRDVQEIKMLQEVALRNAIAMFRAKSKKAAIPELGVFWIDDSGTIFTEGVSLCDAEDYGDFKIFGGNHYDLWEKAIKANPKWSGKEYEEIPRGRVVYKKNLKKPEFIVYLPKKIMKHKNKVINRFNLPVSHTKFNTSDEHYMMSGNISD
jgi:hypothetical protein